MDARGERTSPHVRRVLEALEKGYAPDHPEARFDVDRVNRLTMRIRIVDPKVASLGLTKRDALAWDALEVLPDETFQKIGLVFVLTPEELDDSPTNQMFESEREARLRRRRERSAAADRREKGQ